MSTIKVDAIKDRSDGNTATINGQTPTSSNMQGRNLLINGQFQCWQRGTSITANNSNAYTSDRWHAGANGGEDVVYSRQFTNTSDETPIMRVRRAGTASGRMYLTQMMETSVLDFCRGKTVTFSFKARKHADFDATFVSRIATQTNESPRDDTVVQNSDVTRTLTTSFQTFSQSLTLTSSSDSANGFRVEFVVEDAAGGSSNYYYEVKDCQLEVGDTVTEIEHLPFCDQLAKCHRYAYAIQGTGNPLGTNGPTTAGGSRSFFGYGNAHNSTNPVTWLQMPTTMRAVPSLTVSNNGHFDFDRGWAALATSTSTIIQTLRSSSKAVAIIITTSGLSNGDAGSVSANNSAAYMIFDAEL